MANMIETHDLEYIYPGSTKPVIRGVDLEIRKGELLGIMGPTGAGKTTLLMCLSGLIPLSVGGKLSGEARVDGMKTTDYELSEFIHKIAFVFQDPELQFFGIDVREDIALRLRNMGLTESEIDERVKWALHKVRLIGFEGRFPYTMSGGEKQRVAIAGALAARSEIILLDEPTSELDPLGKREVFDTISELKKSLDTTTVIVEHNAEELARIADRIAVLKDGKIVLLGEPKEVFRKVTPDQGVRIPDVTRLGLLLENHPGWSAYGFPITVEQAYRSLTEVVSKKGLRPVKHVSPSQDMGNRLASALVRVRDLDHVYGAGGPEEKVALNGVSLEIYRGEFIGLIGQNGSGKTTLAKHLIGLLKPTRGEVVVSGIDVRKTKVSKLAEVVGYCFQNPDHQIFKSTVYDEVAFGPRNLLLPEDEVESRVEHALRTVGLVGLEKENPLFLGKGERQKVAVASVISMRPQLLIVDEPSTGMDHKAAIAMMEVIKGLNEEGITVIFITHNMELVAEYAHRVMVLQGGRIILDGSPAWVFNQIEDLQRASLAPPQITQLGCKMEDYLGPGILKVEEAVTRLDGLGGK